LYSVLYGCLLADEFSLGGIQLMLKLIKISCFWLCVSAQSIAEDFSVRQELVCNVAYEFLDPATREKLEPLVQGVLTLHSFRNICLVPMKKNASQMVQLQNESEALARQKRLGIWSSRRLAEEYYMDVPRDTLGVESLSCPSQKRCLLQYLISATDSLASEEGVQKVRWIAEIAAAITQIHYPLSFAFEDDQGGGWVRVKGAGDCARDLNTFWEKCSIAMARSSRNMPNDDLTKYANSLASEISTKDVEKWVDGSTILSWANESFRIATSQRMGYCIWKEGYCRYSEQSLEFDPNGQLYDRYSRKKFLTSNKPGTMGVNSLEHDANTMRFKKLILDTDYQAWAASLTELRVKQAGVRFAKYLSFVL
jgi:hypothetical protein